jgi:hypothetical protein
MTKYMNLTTLLNDAMFELPEWKKIFIVEFIKPRTYGSGIDIEHSTDAIITQRLSIGFCKYWMKKEPEYYNVMRSFANLLDFYFRQQDVFLGCHTSGLM